MHCRVCGKNNLKKIFNHKVLGKYDVDYFFCPDCKFIQTEDPFWLPESYKRSINISDTGYASRNISLARKTYVLFLFLFGRNRKYLDYAGGYGLFTRIMRDLGLDFYTSDKYTENLFSVGFEYSDQEVDAVSCFECFEHFSDPIKEFEEILKISKNIFFSTNLFNSSNIPQESWWYYAFDHGQHVSFYSIDTLKYIAKKYNLFLCSNGKNLHMFLEKKFSNFIFVLLVNLGLLPWDIFSRFITKSKTWSDHKYLEGEKI